MLIQAACGNLCSNNQESVVAFWIQSAVDAPLQRHNNYVPRLNWRLHVEVVVVVLNILLPLASGIMNSKNKFMQ